METKKSNPSADCSVGNSVRIGTFLSPLNINDGVSVISSTECADGEVTKIICHAADIHTFYLSPFAF